jgi:hypothetical protein
MLDFLKTTGYVPLTGTDVPERLTALNKFGRLLMGKLWDVHARDVLTRAPSETTR